MTRSRSAPINIERLCRHHSIEHFNCGEPSFNLMLSQYLSAADDGAALQVFVAVRDNRVLGYVAIDELLVELSGHRQGERVRFLFLAAIATDNSARRTSAAKQLVRKVAKVKQVREEHGRGQLYYGVACAALADGKLARLLTSMGFREPISGFPFWHARFIEPAN